MLGSELTGEVPDGSLVSDDSGLPQPENIKNNAYERYHFQIWALVDR